MIAVIDYDAGNMLSVVKALSHLGTEPVMTRDPDVLKKLYHAFYGLGVSRILFFTELHWNELFVFSRRSPHSMNRWAARYGIEKTGKEILNKAKKGNTGRYAAINLCPYHTIEFRLFRGTLKLNTLIATLQFVNTICDVAISMSQSELEELSWSELVKKIEYPELIQYLKERRLYVNDEVTVEEDM